MIYYNLVFVALGIVALLDLCLALSLQLLKAFKLSSYENETQVVINCSFPLKYYAVWQRPPSVLECINESFQYSPCLQ